MELQDFITELVHEPLASSVATLRKLTEEDRAYYKLQAADANLGDPDFRALVGKLDQKNLPVQSILWHPMKRSSIR